MRAELPPALVLTAGLGTRLAPISDVRAKPAVPVAGTPLVTRVLRYLASHGVRSAVLNLHHRPETVTRCVGHGQGVGMAVAYSWEPLLLGTAGGPRHALELLAPRFFIVNGDTLTDVDLDRLTRAHQASGAAVTLAVAPHPNPARYGGVQVDDAGIVNGFVGPGAHDSHHFVGVQLAEATVFADLDDGVPAASIGGIYDALIDRRIGSVRAHTVEASFQEVGTPREYLETSLAVGAREGLPVPPIGARSRAHPTASIQNSVVWDDVEIGAGCQVVECVVTDGVTLPAGGHFAQEVIVADHSVANGGGCRRIPLDPPATAR